MGGGLSQIDFSAVATTNASSIARSSSSNFSTSNIQVVIMAPTDSPAILINGSSYTEGGTSAAAPNLAGIASLVWSVDPALTAPQVRHILAATTVQSGLLGGSGGYDPNFGYGLVDADAAVRRAVALERSPELANLYTDAGNLNFGGVSLNAVPTPAHGPGPAPSPAPGLVIGGSSAIGSAITLASRAASPGAPSGMPRRSRCPSRGSSRAAPLFLSSPATRPIRVRVAFRRPTWPNRPA